MPLPVVEAERVGDALESKTVAERRRQSTWVVHGRAGRIARIP
jgi:hypothetical protein